LGKEGAVMITLIILLFGSTTHTNTHTQTRHHVVVSSQQVLYSHDHNSILVREQQQQLSLLPQDKDCIFNLPYDTTELELTQHCCQFGLIHNVVIPKAADGISRGFGFVTFDNEEDASFALQALNGHPMNQRTLRADWSKDQPKPRRQRVIITTRGGPPKRR
jgi:hypothetical protein